MVSITTTLIAICPIWRRWSHKTSNPSERRDACQSPGPPPPGDRDATVLAACRRQSHAPLATGRITHRFGSLADGRRAALETFLAAADGDRHDPANPLAWLRRRRLEHAPLDVCSGRLAARSRARRRCRRRPQT